MRRLSCSRYSEVDVLRASAARATRLLILFLAGWLGC